MRESSLERGLIIFFRIAMGWTFLYAGITQVFQPHFSITGFVLHAKTAHFALSWLGQPTIADVLSPLIKWGHVLIGLSLITGCLVRISGPVGVLLLTTYYFGHMDWPYIEDHTNFILDYHLVYDAVLVYLLHKRAGHAWGLDSLLEKVSFISNSPALKACVD
jgi:thiosulfate dehydrogenase [quinone] large subunit